MLHSFEVRAPIELSDEDLRLVVGALRDEVWIPAVATSEEAVVSLSGAEGFDPTRVFQRAPARFSDDIEGHADVFFHRDGIFFVSNVSTGARIGMRSRRLAIGGFGDSAELLRHGVEELARRVADAAAVKLDGRRVRHMKFDWREVASERAFTELAQRLSEGGSPPRFVNPTLDEIEVAAAHVLEELVDRQLLRELSEARFARTNDILERRGDQRTAIEAALNRLGEAELVVADYTVQCRKTSAPLMRVSEPSDLDGTDLGRAQCASCARAMADELVLEGYRITDTGDKLLRGSHWMTVVVTVELVQAGIPLEAIRWNVEESGEEVDIVVDFLGEIWVFELKDREFGAGDAYPFNYRRVRYEAAKALVVTTARVSEDAKRVFTEPSRGGSRAPRGQQPDVICVEGLKDLHDTVALEVARSSRTRGFRLLHRLPLPMPINLPALLGSRYPLRD